MWVVCQSCGEANLYHVREATDFTCASCGGHAFTEEDEDE